MAQKIIRGRKGGGGGGHTPVESPDSIQSIARAKMLFALGEGEFAGGLDGTNIFADGTPQLMPMALKISPASVGSFAQARRHRIIFRVFLLSKTRSPSAQN